LIRHAAILKKHLGFLYAELGLTVGKVDMVGEITQKLGTPVRFQPFLKGRGWGLKYLVSPVDSPGPTHLAKAASRIIERRVARDPAGPYYPYHERFAREVEILEALANIGLGPSVLICESGFFVREFLPGCCLSELAEKDLKTWLPPALEALEKMCGAGIFHTDTNAQNVIVDQENGHLAFIDSEVMVSGPALGEVSPERRLFCHERLLSTVSRNLSKKTTADGGHISEELLAAAKEFYRCRKSLKLSPERAAMLLRGEAVNMRRPQ
jgi:hypothetical protein